MTGTAAAWKSRSSTDHLRRPKSISMPCFSSQLKVKDSSGIIGKLDKRDDEHIGHLSLVFVLSRYVAHHLHDSHKIKMDGCAFAIIYKTEPMLLRSISSGHGFQTMYPCRYNSNLLHRAHPCLGASRRRCCMECHKKPANRPHCVNLMIFRTSKPQ